MHKYYSFSAIVLALAATACSGHHDKHTAEIPLIDVAHPVVDSVVLRTTYPGSLIANREVDLVARVNGYLVKKKYQSGSRVHKGDALFLIEDRNYRDALARAEAQLATARSTERYSAERYRALCEALKGDAVSEMEVVQAKSTLEEARAAVKSAEAALQTAQTQLSYCTVTAPFDGRITSPALDEGSYLSGEGAPVTLATIYDDAEVIANFAIEDARYLGPIRKNIEESHMDYRHIPLTFSERLSKDYTGSLDYLSPKVNTTTGTMMLQALIDNPDGELRSGMFVSVDLPYATDPHAVMVSDAAIASDQLGKYVYLVNDSDVVKYTPVETGQLVGDSMRIITKGIRPDDRYVTKALLKVRDGMKVKPNLQSRVQ